MYLKPRHTTPKRKFEIQLKANVKNKIPKPHVVLILWKHFHIPHHTGRTRSPFHIYHILSPSSIRQFLGNTILCLESILIRSIFQVDGLMWCRWWRWWWWRWCWSWLMNASQTTRFMVLPLPSLIVVCMLNYYNLYENYLYNIDMHNYVSFYLDLIYTIHMYLLDEVTIIYITMYETY